MVTMISILAAGEDAAAAIAKINTSDDGDEMIQGELEALTIKVESLYSQLEIRILNDIVERIRINGFAPATADWEITRLEQLGMSEESIKKWVQSALDAIDDELDELIAERTPRKSTAVSSTRPTRHCRSNEGKSAASGRHGSRSSCWRPAEPVKRS